MHNFTVIMPYIGCVNFLLFSSLWDGIVQGEIFQDRIVQGGIVWDGIVQGGIVQGGIVRGGIVWDGNV